MPVFNAYIPAGRFTDTQKHELSTALPQAMNDALSIPTEDRFVIITEQPQDTLYLDPSYMGMQRTSDAIIITVLFTAERPLTDKRLLTRELCTKASTVLSISADDVFTAIMPVPRENFSFGRGELQLAENQRKH